MVVVERALFRNTYRILWLRYVNGVDLSNHCMKSLMGENDKRVRGFMRSLPVIELNSSPFYYLCGVDVGWRWDRNMHIAFREREGSVIDIDNELFSVRIVNAEQIPIRSEDIDHTLPQSSDKRFSTCRNWWFANWLRKNDLLPEKTQYRKIKLIQTEIW